MTIKPISTTYPNLLTYLVVYEVSLRSKAGEREVIKIQASNLGEAKRAMEPIIANNNINRGTGWIIELVKIVR